MKNWLAVVNDGVVLCAEPYQDGVSQVPCFLSLQLQCRYTAEVQGTSPFVASDWLFISSGFVRFLILHSADIAVTDSFCCDCWCRWWNMSKNVLESHLSVDLAWLDARFRLVDSAFHLKLWLHAWLKTLSSAANFIRCCYSRRRESREYSVHPRLSVCVSVCLHDRTKTAETTIKTWHRDSSPPWVLATHLILGQKVKGSQSEKHISGDRMVGVSLHSIEWPASSLTSFLETVTLYLHLIY